MRKGLLIQGLVKLLSGFVLLGALLFLPAGTWHFPGAWRLMALLFIPMLLLGAVLLRRSPALLQKRLNDKEGEAEQRSVILLSSLAFVVCFVLCGLDFRFGWTQLHRGAVIAASVIFFLSYALYGEVMRENAYLSRTVEVQEGQRVIDTGLYGIVRHPMYTGVTVLFLAMPAVIGSGIGILPMLLMPAILVRRIRNEEKVLTEGLPGYREYKERVKYRLLPGIW